MTKIPTARESLIETTAWELAKGRGPVHHVLYEVVQGFDHKTHAWFNRLSPRGMARLQNETYYRSRQIIDQEREAKRKRSEAIDQAEAAHYRDLDRRGIY